jgi:putative SOS response-associated peptidase YedK
MCGRYSLSCDGKTLVDEFGVDDLADWSPRFNIAPSQPVPVLLQRGASLAAADLIWGLVPAWAKDCKPRSRLINARAETVAAKPSFRGAFRGRRCLVLADGYYEWVKHGEAKQPYYIYPESRRPLAFAGLWEEWSGGHGAPYAGCSIITCAASAELEALHHRMPVVLPKAGYATWLDAGSDTRALVELLKPRTNEPLKALAVSGFVNSPAHEGPDCVKPLQP